MAREEQLAAIQKTYRPIACFHTTFRVSITIQGKTQQANGSLRLDNARQRMLFVFTDTFLGITLTRVTIRDGVAHVDNPHAQGAERKVSIPVDQFSVSGLGSNSIVLPFRLFQDMLYARIPPDVFSPGANVEKVAAGHIQVSLGSSEETYRYGFIENRLRELTYVKNGTGDEVRVSLDGNFEDSSFPQSIRIKMIPKRGRPEEMGIRFRGLNLDARCGDAYFPRS